MAEDGTEREVDTIIFGTGFHVTDMPIADRVRGRDGRTLAEAWNGSMAAYKGTTVAGFPNLFFLVGPNTGLGHNSIVFMIESQVSYIARRAARRCAPAAPTRSRCARRRRRPTTPSIDRMTEGTVWVTGGCTSYYIDRNGHNSALWPTLHLAVPAGSCASFDPAAYRLGARSPARLGEPEPAAA